MTVAVFIQTRSAHLLNEGSSYERLLRQLLT
jgi:hypothetical protein